MIVVIVVNCCTSVSVSVLLFSFFVVFIQTMTFGERKNNKRVVANSETTTTTNVHHVAILVTKNGSLGLQVDAPSAHSQPAPPRPPPNEYEE